MPFTLIGQLLRDFIFGSLMCHIIPYLQGEQNFVLLGWKLSPVVFRNLNQ